MRISDKKRRIIEVDDRRIRKKRRCCRETSMRMTVRPDPPPPATFPLQRLYMSCLDVFKGVDYVPSVSDDQKLRHILDGLMPEDFGLPRNLHFLDPDSTVVVYTTLYVFFLPENGVIPLHNHPGMTVFSKLLLGKVHIKAYDLVNPDNNPSSFQPKLACLKTDTVYTAPCDTSVLYPTSGGNIHAFKAVTPCAFLMWSDHPIQRETVETAHTTKISHEQIKVPEEDGKCYRWLKEIEMPKESKMDRIEYLGPQIIEVN
ncbi:hypothetical protein OSB04_009573 [Centaurea solstitialis]|uniref:cysteine dioxygenase n=1 Tax=Centaurea solstitialis TaxID=347529 RepID=A0AA38WM95_9ASTR|nr:hypothetical protein OSB04_009573 [Centaurea solstitialis]